MALVGAIPVSFEQAFSYGAYAASPVLRTWDFTG